MPKSKRVVKPRLARRQKTQAELLKLVDWLFAHDDHSGLDGIIQDLNIDKAWPAASIRALFSVLAYYAPDDELERMVRGAMSCRETIVEIESVNAAEELLAPLGVRRLGIEQLVDEARGR